MGYYFLEIEKKWQNYWANNQTFKADNKSTLPKYYVLDMFPYPSGSGLHVGHPLGYIASDIYSRYKRHKGFNVLHPQGYDSFGLPAEQYAIQTGQHPSITTEANIKRYREQLDRMGFSFDWSREVRTSQADFYKWTQWIFLLLFDSYYCKKKNKALPIKSLIAHFQQNGTKGLDVVSDEKTEEFTSKDWAVFNEREQQTILLKYRLAYLSETEVNWCPELGTVLANDEIINGVSERGGYPVIKKKMKQWSMRIGAYADRLLRGLDTIDWPEPLKEMQRNWIGKSIGASVRFQIQGHEGSIEVFTTRPDTLFGVTFMTLAPEHDLVKVITTDEQKQEVEAYIEASAQRSERDRMADVKTISGVFTGAYALHPFTQEPVPIWIGDYVLAGYGTGAVMAVPCGDQRDYDFAKHFSISIRNIFDGIDISESAFIEKVDTKITGSDFLNGLTYKEAIAVVIEKLEEKGCGEGTINYRLRDAVFSRQRYWGEPIPVYYKDGLPAPLKLKNLPLALPEVEQYLPTESGKPPLGNATTWAWDATNEEVVENDRIDNKTIFSLELNTMPGWAGSSWYFNRYMDAQNENEFVGKEALNYWQNVDLYFGGSEHATGHLLYSRFWQKFLFDRDLVPVEEYAKKLINQGMILGSSAYIHLLNKEEIIVSNEDERLAGFTADNDENVLVIRVPIKHVNLRDEVDIEALKKDREFSLKGLVDSGEIIFESANNKIIAVREVEKMSKSKYNVVNPDDICEQYGADTLRMYEMFLGPLEQAKPWNTAGISGVHSFLKKLWRLYHLDKEFLISDEPASKESLKSLHQAIKKVTEDIEKFSFNTCISTFMICVNELSLQECNEREVLEPLAILIEPFAPHIAEELWQLLGHEFSISSVAFPVYDESYLVETVKDYPISFNGKMRFTKNFSLDLSSKEIEVLILQDERTQKQLGGRTPKKIIVITGKIINIVN